MPYTTTPTLSSFKSQLAYRLGDPGQVFFPDSDLTSYIQEAIRCWNASALYFKDRGALRASSGVAFHDLTTLTKDTESPLARTLTDRDIVNDIQRCLIEPVTTDWATGWTGTEMFTMDSVTKAIQRRRDQFLVETGSVLTVSETDVGVPQGGRVALSDSIIDVRRCAWRIFDADANPSTYYHLWREDERVIAAYGSNSLNVPEAFSVAVTPQVSLQLYPSPSDIGRLHLVTVNSGATLDTTTGVLLGIPDDFAWVVKFGAMADLLSQDGLARDAERALYCEARWREGIELAKIATTAMHAEINGVPAHLSSLKDLDSYYPSWQNTSGQLEAIGMCGLNYVATAKVPDTDLDITFDVVRNAVVPVNDDDKIQVGVEYHEAITDYALHLAMFKCGGAEFQATTQSYQNMIRLAALNNKRLKANAKNFDALMSKEQKEEKQRRRVAA